MRIASALAVFVLMTYPAQAATIEDCESYDKAHAAIAACTELLNSKDLPRDMRLRALSARANLYSNASDLLAAREDYTRAIQLDPTDASLYFSRADTYFWGVDEKAIRNDFREGVKNLKTFRRFGRKLRIMWRSSQKAEALGLAEEATAVKPKEYFLWALRTEFSQRLGLFEEARKSAQEQLALANDEDKPEALRALALAEHATGNSDDALKHLGEGLKIQAENNQKQGVTETEATFASIYGDRGLVYSALKRYHEAISDLSRAIATEARADWLVLRGAAYVALRDFRKAAEDLSLVISEHPKNALALSMRAQAYDGLSETERAKTDRIALYHILFGELFPDL